MSLKITVTPGRVVLGVLLGGVFVTGWIAWYFKRKRKRKPRENFFEIDELDNTFRTSSTPRPVLENSRTTLEQDSLSRSTSVQKKRSITPLKLELSESVSTLEDAESSLASTVIDTHNPEHLCQLGVRQIKSAIENWEQALRKIGKIDEEKLDPKLEDLQYEIGELLERAYKMQEVYESKAFKDYNTDVALSAALEEMDREFEERKRLRTKSNSSSDADSFVSARSVIDLSDLEDQKQDYVDLRMYNAALLELEKDAIPFRKLRTEAVNCNSDIEFLAKLHCIRAALQEMLSDASVRKYFARCGLKIVSKLFVKADKDPSDFEREYLALIEWSQLTENFDAMKDELFARGVKVLSFYDVVIDFILLDAFEDLDNPPKSFVSVINNRFLSNGFKESALSTAVWSVLKAKKGYLKVSRGFMAHFYSVCEHTSPLLAWGFLGPDTGDALKPLCKVFKENTMAFIRDMFDFDKVRFTNVSDLSKDIQKLAQNSIAQTLEAMADDEVPR